MTTILFWKHTGWKRERGELTDEALMQATPVKILARRLECTVEDIKHTFTDWVSDGRKQEHECMIDDKRFLRIWYHPERPSTAGTISLHRTWGRFKISHEPKMLQRNVKQLLKERDAVLFLNSAHDSFAGCIPSVWIIQMLEWIGLQHPSLEFYLQTKNPQRMLDFMPQLEAVKHQLWLGTTIETDKELVIRGLSKAPPVYMRANAMEVLAVKGFRTRVSHEPLFKFTNGGLRELDEQFKPEIAEIGLDNYLGSHKLPIRQPQLRKYLLFRDDYYRMGVKVVEKKSIQKWLRSHRERPL